MVFSNETVVECVPECFQVSLAFWGNLCPLTDPTGADATSVWVSGVWASIQELNAVARALVSLKEPGILKIEVDEGWAHPRVWVFVCRHIPESTYLKSQMPAFFFRRKHRVCDSGYTQIPDVHSQLIIFYCSQP